MKSLLVIVFLAAVVSVRAQTTVTPFQALHPIMKDPNNRNGPTSLDRYPDLAGDADRPAHKRRPAAPPSAQTVQPVAIVARIDAALAASKISLLDTVNGIKGRMYVTNIGSTMVVPMAQFAVCDQKGFFVGSASKTGGALAPNEAEKIEVLATNVNAVDVKLMKLTARVEN
jgi:hypothetical protein